MRTCQKDTADVARNIHVRCCRAEPEAYGRKDRHRQVRGLLAWLLPQHSARARVQDGAVLPASPRSARHRASSGSGESQSPRTRSDQAGPSSPRVHACQLWQPACPALPASMVVAC